MIAQHNKPVAFSAAMAIGLSPGAVALTPISEQQGFSGYLLLGGGYSEVSSNTVAGNEMIDGGQDTIQSIYESPRSNYVIHGIAGMELRYTLDGKNELFLGGALEDQLTMDFGTQLGWRKQVDGTGIFQLGYLFTGMPNEVWEDPYLVNARRKSTDRDSNGARFVWDKIMGSTFEFTAQYRNLTLDEERSGSDPALDCDLQCRDSLERDGKQYQLWLSMLLPLGGGHFIKPQVRYRHEDRNGRALMNESYGLQLSYSFMRPDWVFVANALYGQRDFDRVNPLYGIRQEANITALDATLLYRLPIESGRWQATASVFWADEDSDIDFHDNKLSQILLGVIYNFGNLPGAQ
jgi:hypothetical protein